MAQQSIFEGIIMIRGKGTGFVSIPDHDEDIVIPPEALSFALDGDVVEIELKKAVPREEDGTVSKYLFSARRQHGSH